MDSEQRVHALAYAIAAMIAGAVWAGSWLRPYHQWSLVAIWVYPVAAALTLTLGRSRQARVAIAIIVAMAATVAPTLWLVFESSTNRPARTAQSEVVIVEQAGVTIARGHNPYRKLASSFELDRLEPATRDHFPYLPLAAVFGLPRRFTTSAWGDARIWLVTGTLLVLTLIPRRHRLTVAMPLVVLPPAALLAATGGDDLAVLAALAVALAATADERWIAAGVAFGIAVGMKQTSWLPAAVVVIWLWRRYGSSAALKVASVAGGIALAAMLPFIVDDPSAAFDDLVRFPLTGSHRDVKNSPTVGGLIAKWTSIGESMLSRVSLVLIVVVLIVVVWRWHARSAQGAAAQAGMALGATVVTSPGVRPGLLVYAVCTLWWAAFDAPHAKVGRLLPASVSSSERRHE